MIKSNLILCAALVGLAVSQANATQITFSGSSATDGTNGNIRTFTGGGITVSASAQSSLTGSNPWTPSYLGIYSNGLGVTNDWESGTNPSHTVDNLNGYDRVVFDFGTSVVLDLIGLSAYGDTDISVYYYAGSAWSLLENNAGGSVNRTADINSGSVSAAKWAVGTAIPSSYNDDFKISSVTFSQPTSPGPATVPDAGGTLLLLALAMGVLFRFQRQTASA